MIRQKPDVVGPDGVNNTFLGFTLANGGYTGANGSLQTSITGCQNNPSYPNFFGTSAATPHVAGIAALMLQANSAVTPTQIYDALEKFRAAQMGGGTGLQHGVRFWLRAGGRGHGVAASGSADRDGRGGIGGRRQRHIHHLV